MRLADAGIMNEGEYFGRFGKIHETVISQTTSHACFHGTVQMFA
jgi:hypothetical protein